MDLIPDDIRPMGLADDVMVVRVAADLFMRHQVLGLPLSTLQKVGRLAADAEVVRAFLGERIYAALEAFVARLPDQPGRGVSPEQVIDDEEVRGRLLRQVEVSLARWTVPELSDPEAFERSTLNYLRAKLGLEESPA
jgi:hypothetical protein